MPVKTYPTERIRNVALVGHGGAGKTSLAEALLYTSGALTRLGRVEDGTTVTDFDPEEARRGISVSLSVAPVEWDGHKINLLDAPGYADFIGDVAAALRAADLAVFVVSAVEGVEVQTELAWRMADELSLPRAIFVNKLDRERASFQRTLDDLKSKFGAGATKNHTVVYEAAGDDTKVTVDGTDGSGAAVHSEWTGKFNGRYYAVTGSPTSDKRSYAKVNSHTLKFREAKQGKVVLTGTITVSRNGKSRTVTTTGKDAKGKWSHNTAVYDKQ